MAKANFDLPADILDQVVKAAGASSKREAIIIALDAYLKRKKIEEILASEGKFPLNWTKKSLAKQRKSS
jgi:uncharacterized protein (DUF2384 family)